MTDLTNADLAFDLRAAAAIVATCDHELLASRLCEAARRLAAPAGKDTVQAFAAELVRWCEEMPSGRLQYPFEIANHIRSMAEGRDE